MKGKFLQEKMVLEFENDMTECVVLNPGVIVGPSLLPSFNSSTIKSFRQILGQECILGVPEMTIPFVDVRDCAQAHINACFVIKEKTLHKKRIAIASKSLSLTNIMKFLQ